MSLKIYFTVLEEIYNNGFNLSQSFNYAPYLFCKKVQFRDQLFLYTDHVHCRKELSWSNFWDLMCLNDYGCWRELQMRHARI